MKKLYLFSLPILFSAVAIAAIPVTIISTTADTTIEKSNEKLAVYSTSTDFPGADGNYKEVTSSGDYPWTFQALNLKAFYNEGSKDADPTTGQLPTDDTYLKYPGLQMYSTFRNTTKSVGDTTVLYPGHDENNTLPLDWMYAYPAGYKTAYDDGLVDGINYTASQQWFKVAGGQWIHPGYNLAVAICFFAPRSGKVTLSDSIYIPSGNYESDGLDLAIYKQSKDYIYKGIKLHSSADAFSLYGANAIYPNPGVNIAEDFTGWQHIPTKQDFTYSVTDISVEKDDMIVFLYGQHITTTSDLTYTSPTVTYISYDDTITLDHFNEPISIGETLQLNATILPEESSSRTITWYSEDDTIARVDQNGLVTGVKAGTTSIWAKLDDDTKAYCLIKVRNKTVE